MKIVVRELTKVFESRKATTTPALGGVSLDVGDGEFLCIVGPSGCGKTTPTAEADRELLRATGRRVARGLCAAGQPVGS